MPRFALTLLLALLTVLAPLPGGRRGQLLGAQGTAQVQIPPPVGLLNDFAHVVQPEQAQRIEAIAQAVRDRSGGEIAVVTLPDIGDRDVGDVALQIGRQWKVGAAAKIGDRTRNAGTVILVVPKQTSSTGQGYVSITTGQGTEGFITDGDAGDIRREATPSLRQGDYGAALALMTQRVAEQYGREFGFSVDSLGVDLPAASGPLRRARGAPSGDQGINPLLLLIIFVVVVAVLSSLGGRGRRRGCGGCIPIFIPFGGGGGGSGGGSSWGGGGWGGGGSWGGGGGGGFGGFGGGGGFSGGGSSGSF